MAALLPPAKISSIHSFFVFAGKGGPRIFLMLDVSPPEYRLSRPISSRRSPTLDRPPQLISADFPSPLRTTPPQILEGSQELARQRPDDHPDRSETFPRLLCEFPRAARRTDASRRVPLPAKTGHMKIDEEALARRERKFT